jgi:2-succinyl-5-enolpyruvyl-6-hydroxy-3-cyclohexene-1-carboxylate synthase
MNNVLQNIQHVRETIAELSSFGIKDAVICPGSRSAAITEILVESTSMRTVSCVDERSAAYLAMGIAQQSRTPVIVVCTSGTAAVNFYPALIESYYQSIPVIFITADRPPEWIDQWDGQTIRQNGLYSNYIKTLTIDRDDVGRASSILVEVTKALFNFTPRPVHLNLPIEEPFYGAGLIKGETCIEKKVNVIKTEVKQEEINSLAAALRSANRPLLIAGQLDFDEKLYDYLASSQFPVLADPCSNLHGLKNSISQLDLFFSDTFISYFPDLIISVGSSVVSKVCKLKLRALSMEQFHIGYSAPGDPFQKKPGHIYSDPSTLLSAIPESCIKKVWKDQFQECKVEITQSLKNALKNNYESHFDMLAAIFLLNEAPDILHFGNSMAIRWAGLLPELPPDTEIYCNRGTSGIDGCLSTAVGHAIASPQKKHWLIIGDLSFFYDRNGLWLTVLPGNLKIIVLNDGGGGIFHIIKGPPRDGKLSKYFQTNHNRSALSTAEDFKINYQRIDSTGSLANRIPLLAKNELCILELFAQMTNNEKSYYSTMEAIN